MLTETLRILASAGYMKGEERIDRRKLALDCAGVLLEKPVEELDTEVIERDALTPGDLRSRLFADNGIDENSERDIDGLIAALVAGDGAVQQLLDEQLGDKYVLCSKRVTRRTINASGQVTGTTKRSGKFVSRDANVINAFYWQEALARYERSTQTLKRRMTLGTRRQPLLASQAPALVGRAHDYLQLELPREEMAGA